MRQPGGHAIIDSSFFAWVTNLIEIEFSFFAILLGESGRLADGALRSAGGNWNLLWTLLLLLLYRAFSERYFYLFIIDFLVVDDTQHLDGLLQVFKFNKHHDLQTTFLCRLDTKGSMVNNFDIM